jgi:protein-S-isoprenylcysteine O-methyltransferase Ste14
MKEDWTMPDSPWWKGRRGEWYVVAQFCLFFLVGVGPRTWNGWPSWPFPGGALAAVFGWPLMIIGGILAVLGATQLGSKICAVPYPQAEAVLRKTGVFSIVRHPMYCGAILAAFGWALVSHSWLTVGYTVLLFVLFDLKSRREEIWLTAKFGNYAEYQSRVRKLIPFVY